MSPLPKESIPQEVFDLYDYYVHNQLDRRSFLEKLSSYAVGGLTLGMLTSALMPDYLNTATISPEDERLGNSDYILYPSPKGGGEIRALCSLPAGEGKFPGIIVVHENRGLNPYIEDVGRRCAVEGFISLAPDALWPLGGYPGDDDRGRELQRQRNREEMLEDFMAAYTYLQSHPNCSGNIGVVGFCFGGWVANMMAVRIPELQAAVPFYGGQVSADETAHIQASLLIHYAALDERINAGREAYEQALTDHQVDYQVQVYENVNHGFHNNTTPRYDAAAADLAWQRTIHFFREKLS